MFWGKIRWEPTQCNPPKNCGWGKDFPKNLSGRGGGLNFQNAWEGRQSEYF